MTEAKDHPKITTIDTTKTWATGKLVEHTMMSVHN